MLQLFLGNPHSSPRKEMLHSQPSSPCEKTNIQRVEAAKLPLPGACRAASHSSGLLRRRPHPWLGSQVIHYDVFVVVLERSDRFLRIKHSSCLPWPSVMSETLWKMLFKDVRTPVLYAAEIKMNVYLRNSKYVLVNLPLPDNKGLLQRLYCHV